ncbi:MAG: hypothetical protein MUO63_06350, partial [Desulfobulbaceae bacterium]|nr:hypothetical protein [Desulfobulbaceae bacterium]
MNKKKTVSSEDQTVFFQQFKQAWKLAAFYRFAFCGLYINFVASLQIAGFVTGHGYFVAVNGVNGTFNFSSQRYGCGACDKSYGQCQSQKFL